MNTARTGSLGVIFLTVFIDLLGFGMVLPLLPLYAQQFSADQAGWQLGLLMASFSFMQFFFAPIWGRVSDSIGRRPVLLVGLFGSVVFYALFGIATEAQSLVLLFVARIGAGVTGATISTAQAYIADCTTVEKRSKGMALIGMAFGLGFTLGPLFGLLAVPSGQGAPGPWPGYAAAIISAVALLLAIFRLPESRHEGSENAGKSILDVGGFKHAVATGSIVLVLISIFICIFSFANFETTLSMLIKGGEAAPDSPFQFEWRSICLTYAFIGVTLSLVQGGIVRRLSGRISDGAMAASGAVLEVAGFLLTLYALQAKSVPILFVALGVVVAGFSFMQPSLNALLSRRSDPARQGMILGVGQSVSSMARIVGAAVSIPMLKADLNCPYLVAAVLMLVGLLCVLLAARGGKDYEPKSNA
ncbi:MAG: MFS transporter [Pirellulaceae bacterium]|jgi:MFS family permease|nr:MFS transporter [Pirellulaceae bacterium]